MLGAMILSIAPTYWLFPDFSHSEGVSRVCGYVWMELWGHCTNRISFLFIKLVQSKNYY